MKMHTKILLGAFVVLSIVEWQIQAAKAEDVGTLAIPPKALEVPKPPLASLGVKLCDKLIVVWAVLPDGSVKRFDKAHKPSTDEGYKAFVAWLDSAPITDIYTADCPVKT